MNGDGCSTVCGYCGKCTVDDGYGTEDELMETCRHPAHWRRETGTCGLCGAEEPTITKQARQRSGIQAPLPRTGAA